MADDDKAKIEEQLDAWRTKIDELRVKASLLKMEYRDKPLEAQEQIEQAYESAKAKFLELKDAGGEEAAKLGAGFAAAWAAFKDKYDGMTEDE